MPVQRRIRRNYRQNTPGKFLAFCQKVKHGLTDNVNYPESTWGVNTAIRQQFFEMVANFEATYHLAINGDRNLIRERDKLQEEIVVMLEEIASLLEAASIRNPDALYTTGFDVTQERRSTNRTKLPLVSPAEFTVVNSGERAKALASASPMPGAFNHEIHINRKDPSAENDWFHKAIFPDAASMVMDSLEPGNTFFRMRHHGPDGPGPWSTVVSATIS